MALIKLGKYIEISDLRNTEDRYNADAVVGISTQKKMISTKADLDGVKLTSYKLLPPGYFAYVPDTSRRGDKMSLCFNNTKDTYIVSSISVVFYINNEDELNPDYLFMYFNRPEFDRYARFNSWGSARETFDWSEMCDIEIELPPIEIQRKFAAVYVSMLENQQSYERGLEDLRTVCDGYFDKLKKDKTVIRCLGDYIEKMDAKNSENLYGESSVRGITNKKEFDDTKADIKNTDLSKFLVIPHDTFAYNSRTDGRDMLVLALNRESESVIVTWNYNAFMIKKESKKQLNPEYLYALFKRKEFDRLVRYMSWGSSQELFSWDSLCEVMIPVPEIEVQNAIAEINNVYVERKSINERLKAQIKDMCPILIKGSIEEARA